MNKKAVIYFFACIIACVNTVAQPTLHFRHFTTQQGLSQNTITCILQDQFGFIWLGTEDGLNRYNGYDVDMFKHNPSDERTISHSNIRCMVEDTEGVIWIGTDDGLNSYDRASERFVHYRNDPKNTNSISNNIISSVVQDQNGLLWIGTNNGLNCFDRKNNKWTSYRHRDEDATSISHNNISCLAITSGRKLLVGTNGGGLNVFDLAERKTAVFKNNSSDASSLSGNEISAILEDKKHTIWVGTVNEGLNKFDITSGKFVHYKNNPEEDNSLSQNSVFSICDDADGLLWIGTLGGGLNVFNPATEKFSYYKNSITDLTSISNNNVWAVFIDNAGTIWIGTANGINILDKKLRRFETLALNPASQNNSVYCLYEDMDGTLWFGLLGGGLISVDKSGAKKNYLSDPANENSITSNAVFSVCGDADGIIYIGTYDGLNLLDKKTGKIIRYKNITGSNNSLSNNYVRSLLIDKAGMLWIGTYGGGLNMFNKASGKFTQYKNDAASSSSLSNNIVTDLYEDKEGTLWVGTYGGGLCSFDKTTQKFSAYKNDSKDNTSISNNFINCIAENKNNLLWVGTYGGGLNAFDKSRKTFTRYSEQDGLPNNSINAIEPDVNGNLWISTSKGLCRFNTEKNSPGGKAIVRTYDSKDGAQDKYNENASLKTKSGKYYFGGASGINSFFYDEIKDNQYLPPVVITRFYLFEKPHTMDTMITSKRTVELSYNQNFFSFEFAGLNYTFPEKNQYAYMMEGLDKDWNYCNNRRYAAYTNIDPGEYTFRVKASNNDGIWNEQGTLLRITIKPPFWKTWWFSIFAGLAVASSIVLYIRFRTRTLLKQNTLLEHKVEQRTSELKEKNSELVQTMDNLKATQDQLVQSEKMASLGQLTAGIAHEIQNPLNFVNNFSMVSVELIDDIQQGPPQEAAPLLNDLKNNLQKIKHHGQRAERIVKGMLMHSRSGQAEKQLTDLNKLLADSLNLAYTGIRAKDNSFTCDIKTNYDNTIPLVNIIPQDISRVALNIINNAFYAMNDKINSGDKNYKPSLFVSSEKKQKTVIIKIKDNGSGIPKNSLDKIFQPFFTTKPAGDGTGLGLSLSYDIITKGHGGEIKVESEEGNGCTFSIILPY